MLAETICSAVSAAGLGIAAIAAYRKRFLSAARIAAYALVPLGLVMTGVVAWVVDTATFNPVAWTGFGLLGASWLLFLSTRAVERRRGPREKAVEGTAGTRVVAPGASAPSRGAGTAGPAAARSTGEDFSDIEAILKKHGI